MSNAIKIDVTETTPEVLFDIENGVLSLKGKSIPENPKLFYEPLLKHISTHSQNPSSVNSITIEMEYFNTPSAKYLLEIFKHYDSLAHKGNPVTVNWNYEKGDSDMLQAGKDYEAYLTNLTFKLNEIF